jgi:hypothetical protein
VKLVKTPHHEFLRWDSHLECGEPLEIDEYISHGCRVIGCVHSSMAAEIYAAVLANKKLSARDKEVIRLALGC